MSHDFYVPRIDTPIHVSCFEQSAECMARHAKGVRAMMVEQLVLSMVRRLLWWTGAVLAVGAAVLLVAASYRPSAKEQTALAQMAQIGNALEEYRFAHHHYPTTSDGLHVLTEGSPPMIAVLPEDPWGHQFVYEPDSHTLLRSRGRDGILDSDDDLRPGDKPHRYWGALFDRE